VCRFYAFFAFCPIIIATPLACSVVKNVRWVRNFVFTLMCIFDLVMATMPYAC